VSQITTDLPIQQQMRRFKVLLLVVFTAALMAPAVAGASKLIVRNATHITLKVNAKNRAVVSYRAKGIVRHVLVWGAINAKPPDRAHPDSQVKFHVDYSGGSASPWGSGYWRRVKNACTRWRGSGVTLAVTVCTMPDGSHWALQSWKRLMPNGGYKCCQTPQQGKRELHISHWKGPLAQLWLKWNWTRATSQYPHLDKLFGRATYKGVGTYGFSNTRTGAPTDSFGRLVFVDTYNPPKWGKGWRRENSFLVHRPSDGGFCDTLWPNRYGRHHASGYGQKYRATMDGPGVTPIVRWKGPPPGNYAQSPVQTRDGLADFTITGSGRQPFDALLDSQLNTEQQILAGSSADKCFAIR
jgi:hypothetical protein